MRFQFSLRLSLIVTVAVFGFMILCLRISSVQRALRFVESKEGALSIDGNEIILESNCDRCILSVRILFGLKPVVNFLCVPINRDEFLECISRLHPASVVLEHPCKNDLEWLRMSIDGSIEVSTGYAFSSDLASFDEFSIFGNDFLESRFRRFETVIGFRSDRKREPVVRDKKENRLLLLPN